MSLFDEQSDDRFKGCIHGAMLVLALEVCAYNAVVLCRRGAAWHGFAVVAYAGLIALECTQIRRHVKGCQ